MSERVDVQQLRDLLDKATPRPWTHLHVDDQGDGTYDSVRAGDGIEICYDERCVLADEGFANIALIVAAVNSLPALLAHLDALEEVAEAADLIHAHGSGAPIRQPESCPLCAALARLQEEERND